MKKIHNQEIIYQKKKTVQLLINTKCKPLPIITLEATLTMARLLAVLKSNFFYNSNNTKNIFIIYYI